MAKSASAFVCQNCGAEFFKWSGNCSNCGEWNSLVETVLSTRTRGKGRREKSGAKPIKFSEVEGIAERRIPSGIGELDRVLGGGIVPGSVVLVAGEPGIGKSTLLTQLALRVGQESTKHEARNPKPALLAGRQYQNIKYQNSKKNVSKFDIPSHSAGRRNSNLAPKVLYVCGEESPGQVKMRVERLQSHLGGVNSTTSEVKNLLFFPVTDVDEVIAQISRLSTSPKLRGAGDAQKIGLVIVDSIQTMYTQDLTSAAGSVSQVSESTSRLLEVAKRESIPVCLVGHVTKQGAIAGPKVLEHMVDTVLELTGDRQHEFRVLRATKNRFGATDEVGIFSMEDGGMQEVTNPSDRLLADRQEKTPGSCVVCVLEGTRPMLVEIQALVVPSPLAVPRRVASGVDPRRVQLLTAVLMRRCGLRLGNMDVYVNVAGGLTIREPATDLGIALAITSSSQNKPLPKNSVAVGEVGLLGEVRKVGRLKQRIAEAKALGFTRFVTSQQFSSLSEVIRAVL